jgi:hypothetical protein
MWTTAWQLGLLFLVAWLALPRVGGEQYVKLKQVAESASALRSIVGVLLVSGTLSLLRYLLLSLVSPRK